MKLSDFNWSDMITKVVAAIIILVITAVIARVLKKVLTRQLSKVKVLQRGDDGGDTLAMSLGTIASLIVWLLGLMAVINLFALTQVIAPLQDLLGGILGALPKILGAGILMFIGFVLAKIARELVVTALQAAKADRFLERLERRASAATETATGTATGTPTDGARTDLPPSEREQPGDGAAAGGDATGSGKVRISTMVGQLVFAVILLVVAISAVQVLAIKAISGPATQMLSVILNALPLILAAGILLALGVVIARFAGQLLETVLRGLRLDSAVERLGVDVRTVDLPAILSRVAQVAIVLFFAVAATKTLNFPEVTQILDTILGVAGHVAFGAAVILAGVFVAKLVASFASGHVATVIRYGTIVLFVAIGLKYMGLANSIINLAFGALVVGGAAAAALAYGLGGRDAAARQLESIQDQRDRAGALTSGR